MIEGKRAPALTLLASKTKIPFVRQDALVRSRLTSLLTDADTPLSLVVAPAGWGKTTLLAQWARVASRSHPVGWVTLDATDNEPHRFWSYVIASLRHAGSQVGESALAALGVPRLDPIEVAIPRLLNDFAATDQPHSMVLDDYHLVDDRQIREAVEFFITYLPANAKAIIGSRLDPPLPLALWRGRGMVTEVRAEHLRFEADEVTELLGQVATMQNDRSQTADVMARTEGWAAGLQLVLMAVRGAQDPARKAAAMRGDSRHLIDYVATEVLGPLTARQRDFIVRASVLDQLSAPLCDRVLGIDDSALLLEGLEWVDPFITRLDEAGVWYRWHPIVRDVLRRELDHSGADQRAAVLKAAAEWYLLEGDIEQAVRHLISAGDTESAVRLLLRHEADYLDAGNIETFLTLAEAVGPQGIENEPGLGLSMAWAAFVCGRIDRVGELLDQTQSALKGDEPPPMDWRTVSGSISTLRALGGYESSSNLAAAQALGTEAVSLETDPTLPGYSVARFALGLVLVAQTRLEEALSQLEEAWSRSDAIGMPVFARLPIAGVLTMCLIDLGRTDDAQVILTGLAPVARRLETALGEAAGPAIGGVRMSQGRLELDEADLARARLTLAGAVAMVRVAGHPSQTARALLLLAEAELEAENNEAAHQAIAEAREIARNDAIFPATAALLEAMEARVGRSAVRAARSDRRLFEDLTDREISILRALAGPLSQREIGRELYLSINTVKGYTKSLYRKLSVSSRGDAVERSRELGII